MPELLILAVAFAISALLVLATRRHARLRDRARAYERWHEDSDIADALRAYEDSTRNGRAA